jgi:outer membrane protein assembly factor BamD
MRRSAAPILALLLCVTGCGAAALQERSGGTASFDSAKAAYDRGDWVEAQLDFKAYVEQYPGTDRTDDALYYLGLAYFKTKDYALASTQFDRLTRDFPQSPYQPDAMFYLARCDDLDSRPAPLDQTETQRAIDRYKQFLDTYPDHAHAAEARQRTQALRDRLAEKHFRNGRLYAKLNQRQAAAIYLRELIEEYPESRWAGDAALLLADVLLKLGRKDEAIEALRKVPPAATPEVRSRAAEQLRSLGAGESGAAGGAGPGGARGVSATP